MSTASIVIPCFNHGHVLPRAIASAVTQLPDVEVIVVDDGSWDDSALVARDAPVEYVYQPNAGPGAARNNGLARVTTDHVLFLDADDELAPGSVQRLREALMRDPDAFAAYGDHRHESNDGSRDDVGDVVIGHLANPLDVLLRANPFRIPALLIRTEFVRALGGFDEERNAQEDWDLWLRAALRGYRFVYSPGVAAIYHMDDNRTTTDPELMYRRGVHLLRSAQRLPDFECLDRRSQRAFRFEHNWSLARRSANNGWLLRWLRHLVAAACATPGRFGAETAEVRRQARVAAATRWRSLHLGTRRASST